MIARASFRKGVLTVLLGPTCVHEQKSLDHWEGKDIKCVVRLYPHPFDGSDLQELVFTFTPGREIE